MNGSWKANNLPKYVECKACKRNFQPKNTYNKCPYCGVIKLSKSRKARKQSS